MPIVSRISGTLDVRLALREATRFRHLRHHGWSANTHHCPVLGPPGMRMSRSRSATRTMSSDPSRPNSTLPVSRSRTKQTARSRMETEMALFDTRGIDHVGIRYRDLPRAVAWFRDVLGLPIEHQTRTMAFVG